MLNLICDNCMGLCLILSTKGDIQTYQCRCCGNIIEIDITKIEKD
jgi:hypothetical protein